MDLKFNSPYSDKETEARSDLAKVHSTKACSEHLFFLWHQEGEPRVLCLAQESL